MNLITETEKLAEACHRLARHSFVTIDTEFLRESTFWPKLCLIQIASPDEELLIDPLSESLDLAPFFELMTQKTVTKVFHAARQDLEIIHHQAGIIPAPLFDTQIAAMVCGFGESVSYGQLVKTICRMDLDKSSRFTDWSRRPLSDKQLHYALGDVTYLRDIYLHLQQTLESSSRASWLIEEMDVLMDPETYLQSPENAWKRLKMRVKTAKSLAILMEISAWREREAQRVNVPRGRIIKDEAIYDIATQAPQSVEELGQLRTVSEGFAKSNKGREILASVEKALSLDTASLPKLKKTKPLPAEASAVIDLLRVLLKAAAAKHDVASKLIATSEDLEKIARSDKANVPALKGWRYELFGTDALALKQGSLSLTVENGEIITRKTTSSLPVSEDDAPQSDLRAHG